jgi:DNA invertase Pin-like site-specific DNA recombinase
MRGELPTSVISRRALVYVRQSTGAQVLQNTESQRLQYALADQARAYGFRDVVTIDEDLGRSASGWVDRPGFRSLVAQLCEGSVGAIFCLEASRLSRNGRDWHHLLELCGLVGARLIDPEGVYDPSHPNDRLLLGLKGSVSEFELTVLRRRLLEAAVAKARRGELRIAVPVGYKWSRETGLEMDPDQRIQTAIRTVFRLFSQLGSARQVLLRMRQDGLLFPRPADGKRLDALVFSAPAYRNVIALLHNPFYAGAYVYGKSISKTRIVEGEPRKSYGHERPSAEWTVLLREHHSGYIDWETFVQNQERLGRNAFCKPSGGAKSSRGGRALLAGLLRCRRCGRMLQVAYTGRGLGLPRYCCKQGNLTHGDSVCIRFGASRPDRAIAEQILLAVHPLAVEAACVAQQRVQDRQQERTAALQLEYEQAQYEVRLAARRYEAVDPDNRLVVRELEARWNAALSRLRDSEARIGVVQTVPSPAPTPQALQSLALDLEAAWQSPSTSMRVKQQLVRLLIREIVVDIEESQNEIILLIHWHGGQHSEHRVQRPRSGEHTRCAAPQVHQLVLQMASQWSDEHIAATLNRMGSRTGQGNPWTARRVQAYRLTAGIPGYQSAVKDGRCLTLVEAAARVGVSSHALRKLIKDQVLPATQVMPDAPWQILAADLQRPAVQEALRHRRLSPRSRPAAAQPSPVPLAPSETRRSDA